MPRTRLARGLGGELFVMFWCPGCDEYHGPRVEGGASQWQWNGDRDRPTLSPSILVTGKRRITDDEHARLMRGEAVEVPDSRCHSFVRDGRIEFLSDCTHALAGQVVELPDDPGA